MRKQARAQEMFLNIESLSLHALDLKDLLLLTAFETLLASSSQRDLVFTK